MVRELFFTAALLLLFVGPSFGQSENFSNENQKEFKGRFSQTNGFGVKFEKGKIVDNKFIFKDSEENKYKSIGLDEVGIIEKQTGSYAVPGGILMGASGLLGSLLGLANAQSDPFVEVDKDSANKAIVGLTIGSALVGLLIGSGVKKYKKVYENDKFKLSQLQLKVSWSNGNTPNLVGFKYSF